jgi:hypothetical protein
MVSLAAGLTVVTIISKIELKISLLAVMKH